MSTKMFIIVGVPASGKTWITKQLTDKYTVLPHDNYIGQGYTSVLIATHRRSDKPVLGELPFGITEVCEAINDRGISIELVFVTSDPDSLQTRYKARDGKDYPKAHLSRQATYIQRAKKWGSFIGNSNQVLEYLKNKVK